MPRTKLLEEQSAILQQLENQSRILVEKRNTLEKSLLEKENYVITLLLLCKLLTLIILDC